MKNAANYSREKTVHAVFFSILFFANVFAMCGQDNYAKRIAQLRTQIGKAEDDTLKVNLYHDLCLVFIATNDESQLLETAEQGLKLAKELEFDRGVVKLILDKAIALDLMGEAESALTLFNEGVDMTKRLNYKGREAIFYLNIGACYYFMGNSDMALKYYLMSYDLSEYLEKDQLGPLLNNIGIIYRYQEDFERAEEIYLKSFELREDIKDSLGMATSLMNLGLVYNEMEDKEDLAIYNLEKSKKLSALLRLPYHIAVVDVALGKIYNDLDSLSQAQEKLEAAWNYFKGTSSVEYKISTLGLLGDIAKKQQQYKKAEAYFENGMNMLLATDQRKDYLEFLYRLSLIKKDLGKDDEAYILLKKAYAVKDTLNDSTRVNTMKEMQTKFDVKQKDAELEISELKLDRRTRQRNIYLFGALGLGVFAFTLLFFFRSKIRANKKIALQTEQLQIQKITELQQQNKLLALNSMIEGQETERLRIAKDLHDSLGGLLSTVKAHFTSIQSETKQLEKLNVIEKTNNLIDEACVEVRRISHNMIPHALTLSGLPVALEDLADNLRTEGFDVDLNIKNFPNKLEKTKQAMIYRLIQEVVSNIRKHASAKNILIQVLSLKTELSLILEDDGIGFNYKEALTSGGVGVKSINSRVEYLNGSLDWDSHPGEGTTLTINIPLP